MNLWLTIGLAGVATYAIRLSFIVLLARVSIPLWFRQALRFVPIAVLSAIIAPELVMQRGAWHIGIENTRLIAGLIAVGVAWRTHNVLLTVGVGMGMLLLLQWLMS